MPILIKNKGLEKHYAIQHPETLKYSNIAPFVPLCDPDYKVLDKSKIELTSSKYVINGLKCKGCRLGLIKLGIRIGERHSLSKDITRVTKRRGPKPKLKNKSGTLFN
jgi:hypothetical protein